MQAMKSKKMPIAFKSFKLFLIKYEKSNKKPLARPARKITNKTKGWFKVGYSIAILLENSL